MPLRARSLLYALAAGAAALTSHARAQDAIVNTARLTFQDAGASRSIVSNTVTLQRERATPGRSLNLMRLAAGAPAMSVLDASGARCMGGRDAALAAPSMDGASFDPAAAPLRPAQSLHLGEPLFIDVAAPDADANVAQRDRLSIIVSTAEGDREELSLQETGAHTGRFAGFIATGFNPSAAPGDCRLSTRRGRPLTVSLAETAAGRRLTATVTIDPYGYVFNAQTGAPVDGARITLVDDATGAPARVRSDDGVSDYPATVVSGRTVIDGAGVRHSFRTGEYRFPKVVSGRYHLRIEPPGGLVAPSRTAPGSLAPLAGPADGESLSLSDASWGRSFAVTDESDLSADIPVDGQAGKLVLEKAASASVASAGDVVRYRLTLNNPDAGRLAAGVRVVDRLPEGFRYVRGSARLDEAAAPDPERSSDGRSLTFSVGDMAAAAGRRLSYLLTLGPDARSGLAVNRAQAFGEAGLASNRAQASVRVRAALYDDRVTLIGRVTEGPCGGPRVGVADVRVLLQDGSFAVTDANGLYHLDGVRPGLQVVQLDAAALPTGLKPGGCGHTTRRGGSRISQFVDARDGVLARADFQLTRVAAGPTGAAIPVPVGDAGSDRDWFVGLKPGVQWLYPAADHNPRAPATRVVIAHRPDQRVELTVDGAPVDAYAGEGQTVSADGGMAVSAWRGVALREGDTTLVARILERDGKLAAQLTRRVHYANRPAHAEVLAARSTLTADGLARPVVAIRLTDAAGAPVRAGVMGTFKVAAPYAPFVDASEAQQRRIDGQEPAGAAWRVEGDDGVALIALAPTPRAGEAVIDLPLPGDAAARPTQVRAWLQADRRDWVMVGFAAGTLGFDTLSRHVDPLNRRHPRPGVGDGQLAFYAKGRVKGSWLLTLAYDNKRTADRDRGLMGGIDPDRNYTVFGDASQGGYDAQTTRKLYLRLERREFYALFGDFQTGFAASELGRYERTLNGLKFERRGRVFSFAGFAAESDQTRVRDEIQGSGLSGPYRLSRRNLLVGAEQIVIETRDRLRSERVLSTRALAPRIDYDVDYDAGALTFTFPVLSRDAEGNPNIIVARYETTGDGRSVQAGGRASASLAGGRAALGVTYLHDGQGARGVATDLAAVDAKLRLRADTELRLEAAVSDRDARGALRAQTAYVAELAHRSGPADLLAYYRRQDVDFGVGQQAYSEAGAEKVGLDARLRLPFGFTLAGAGRRETYAATGAVRDAVDARLDWVRGDWTLNLGLKLVHDDTRLGGADSRLLTLGAGRWMLGHRLQLTGSTDVSLGGAAESLDFPVRRRVGAAYAFSDDLRVTVDGEIAEGAAFTTQTTGAGVEWRPWRGGRITGGLGGQELGGVASADGGPRTFSRFGLAQSVALDARWTVDLAVDTTSTLSGHVPTAALVNAAFPSASGATTYASGVSQAAGLAGVAVEDFRSLSLGAAYRSDAWSWTGRGEARFGATADTWNVSSAALRRLAAGVTAVAGARASGTRTMDGGVASQGQAEVSLAWRPLESRWSVLERLEYRHDAAQAGRASASTPAVGFLPPAAQGDSDRIVSNLAVNYDGDGEHRFGGVQAAAFLGAKYVRGRFGDDAYSGFTNVVGGVLRFDLTRRVDVGLQGAVRTAWAAHAGDYAAGVSIGLSPAADTWISVGWNVAGFRDRDFERAAHTRRGPFITARMKFDQQTLGAFARLLTARS